MFVDLLRNQILLYELYEGGRKVKRDGRRGGKSERVRGREGVKEGGGKDEGRREGEKEGGRLRVRG